MNCPYCAGEAKFFAIYRNRNRIVRRFRCTVCGKTFSETQPLQGVRISPDKVAQVVSLLCEGTGVRATARLTQLHQETVLNVLETIGAACLGFHDRIVRNVQVGPLQIDELYAFVHCKQNHNRTQNPEWGEQYTFLTLCRSSKLVLSFCTGKRTHENAHEHLGDVRSRINGQRPQISTDNFKGYRGRDGAVIGTFGFDGVDYGMLTKVFAPSAFPEKRYSPPVCILCKKRAMVGRPDPSEICTSHVERQNLNVRLFNRRFTRLTLGFSKKLENLRHSVALLVCYWNFCWLHHTLKRTPAQAAGLADHRWTARELVDAVSATE